MSNEAIVQRIMNLRNQRKMVVIAAIVFIVMSQLRPNPILVWPRGLLLILAGVLSVMEGALLKKAGVPPNRAWVNAAIFIAVAVLPMVMRGM